MLSIRSLERYLTVLAVLVCSCSLVATGVVTFGKLPPVYNQSHRANVVLNLCLLGVLTGVIVVLAGSYYSAKLNSLRRPVLLALTVLVTLEFMLFVFDKTVISVEGSAVPSASHTVLVDGEALYIAPANAMSPLGFRSPRVEPKTPQGKRILFLGNSYIAGSGTSFSTNYPQATEAELQKLTGSPTTIFSAGENGYGVVEDLLIYKYLTEQGYHFNSVVLNFMLGSDPTNDIPGTTREVMVGQAQRLHSNRFLRYFYPINSYLFRYAVYLDITMNRTWWTPQSNAAANAPCRPTADFAAFSKERTGYYYGLGAQQRIDMNYTMRVIDQIALEARRNGAEFRIVLMPDPNSLLASNREQFRGVPMDWDWIRNYMLQQSAGRFPFLDLTSTFENSPEMYRCGDTHWNDAGNLRAADVVARYFASDNALRN
jgi:hypothetical protein